MKRFYVLCSKETDLQKGQILTCGWVKSNYSFSDEVLLMISRILSSVLIYDTSEWEWMIIQQKLKKDSAI